MITNETSHNKFIVFGILTLLMSIVVYFQSYFLYSFPSIFKQIDFVTIILLLIFFQNTTLMSMMIAIVTGSFLDAMSTIKPGFFTFYYLFTLILVKLAENFFYRESFLYKLTIFILVFFIKFIFLYSLIDNYNISIITFIAEHYLQFLVSICVFVGLNIFINMTGSIFHQSYANQKIR